MAKRKAGGTSAGTSAGGAGGGLGPPTVSVAQSVRSFIDARPVVRDALGMGIVNLSALTRQIREETGLGSEEAVLVACRRYHPRHATPDYQAAIRKVLDKSK